MNSAEFKEQARIILLNQSKENVDRFFSLIDKGPGIGLSRFPKDTLRGSSQEIDDEDISHVFTDEEKSRTCLPSDKRKNYFDALHHVIEIINFEKAGLIRYIKVDDLYDELTRLYVILFLDIVLQTPGRRSQLNFTDLMELATLRDAFIQCFPNLSAQYKAGYLLGELGRALVDKPIPRTINKMFEKLETHIRQMEGGTI